MSRPMNAKSMYETHQQEQPKETGIQQNIGKIDRYVRLAAGIFLVANSLSTRRQTLGSRGLMAIGAMGITEGVLGWCPVMHMFGVRNLNGALGNEESSSRQSGQSSSADTDHYKKQDGQHSSHGNDETRDQYGTDQHATNQHATNQHATNQHETLPSQEAMTETSSPPAARPDASKEAATKDINTSFN